MSNGYVSDGYGDTSFTYRYDSRQDDGQARPGYDDSPDWGDGLGSGHHPSLCSSRCPCKAQNQGPAARTASRAA